MRSGARPRKWLKYDAAHAVIKHHLMHRIVSNAIVPTDLQERPRSLLEEHARECEDVHVGPERVVDPMETESCAKGDVLQDVLEGSHGFNTPGDLPPFSGPAL